MSALKKYLGVMWVMLGPASMLLLTWQAWEKINLAKPGIETTNTALQWGIILLIFIPIAIGLVIFGKYALTGEYTQLPESSEAL
jgi:hypothetical protein